jgi:hypothetical protein
MIRSTCSWKTTTPPVSSSASRSSECGKLGVASPCLTRRNGLIMSELTGPGRNSEMSTMRSSMSRGASFFTSSRWPGDSIWKQPIVRDRWIIA